MILTVLFNSRYLPHITRTLKPKTVHEYTRLIRVEVLPRLGQRDIAKLTLDDAEELHAAVPGKVQANRAVSYLSGMLTYAVRRRLLLAHPCRGVKRNRERGREFFYMPEQTKAILSAASAWTDIRARYIALELLTGVRPGELLESGPSWRHGAVLRLPDDKTNAGTVYLSDAACAILDGLTPVSIRGILRYFPEGGMDLRRAWVRICRDAGVPRARQYDLRHTFASAALAAGESLPVVGLLLRHRKFQTTMRYAHLSPDIALRGAEGAAARMGA